MHNQKGYVVISFIIICAVFFIFVLSHSIAGWGYAGFYNNRSHPPSRWSFNRTKYYESSSARSGSVSGSSALGGGPRSGK